MSRRARDGWIFSDVRFGRHQIARQRSGAGTSPYSRRLRVERLEDRRLLSITVDTLADGIGVPGTSLREALAAAVTGDTINFSVTGQINLANSGLGVTKSLTIQGPGANLLTINASTIAAGPTKRCFGISDSTAALINVELIGLRMIGGGPGGMGGAIGGGILNSENLTLTSCVVSGNAAGVITSFSNGQGGGIWSGANLTVVDSTISGNVGDGGGGIFMSGGNLTVSGSTISGNVSRVYGGGGISALGDITVTGSTISGNTATGQKGGGIYERGSGVVSVTSSFINGSNKARYGAGIFSNGSVSVSSSNVSNNQASTSGGGIYKAAGTLTVSDSMLSGNTATSNGGGIFNNFGQLNVTNSTLSGNTANSQGGGIYSLSATSTVAGTTLSGNTAAYGGGLLARNGSMTVAGSTISGNQSPNSNGGGIESVFATLNVSNSTVSGNTSGAGGGILSYFSTSTINYSTITGNNGTFAGGGINVTGGSMTLNHTIVSGNLRGSNRDDVSGAVSARYSLIGDNTGASITNNGGNQIGTGGSPINALLGPLMGSGGPTSTHTLLAGSPAIDAGDPAAVAGAGGVPQFDQRGAGYARVADGDGTGGARIDIGAFEVQPPPGPALPGDYNLNDVVDAADYVLWRKTLGVSGVPAFSGADGDGDTAIDQDDYGVWRANFGAGSGGEGAISEDRDASFGNVAPDVVASGDSGSQSPANPAAGYPAATALALSSASVSIVDWRSARFGERARVLPPAEPGVVGRLRDDALVACVETAVDAHERAAIEFEAIGTNSIEISGDDSCGALDAAVGELMAAALL